MKEKREKGAAKRRRGRGLDPNYVCSRCESCTTTTYVIFGFLGNLMVLLYGLVSSGL